MEFRGRGALGDQLGAGGGVLNSPTLSWATLEAALAGAAQPWLICVALVLTTLLLEDVAIAAGVALAAKGLISWELSFAAVAGGIAAGDLGLYALGLAARRVDWLRRRYVERPGLHSHWAQRQLERQLPSAMLLARVIPGLRLLTYTACGFFRIRFLPFTAWVVLAVFLWTAGLYWLGAGVGGALAAAWGIPLALAVALPILLIAALLPLLRRLLLRPRMMNP